MAATLSCALLAPEVSRSQCHSIRRSPAIQAAPRQQQAGWCSSRPQRRLSLCRRGAAVVVAADGAGGASLQLATARLPSGVNREVFAQQMWVPLNSCALACTPSRELRQLPHPRLWQQAWPPAAITCSRPPSFQPLPAQPPPASTHLQVPVGGHADHKRPQHALCPAPAHRLPPRWLPGKQAACQRWQWQRACCSPQHLGLAGLAAHGSIGMPHCGALPEKLA